jgi:hypothetical protein
MSRERRLLGLVAGRPRPLDRRPAGSALLALGVASLALIGCVLTGGRAASAGAKDGPSADAARVGEIVEIELPDGAKHVTIEGEQMESHADGEVRVRGDIKIEMASGIRLRTRTAEVRVVREGKKSLIRIFIQPRTTVPLGAKGDD